MLFIYLMTVDIESHLQNYLLHRIEMIRKPFYLFFSSYLSTRYLQWPAVVAVVPAVLPVPALPVGSCGWPVLAAVSVGVGAHAGGRISELG